MPTSDTIEKMLAEIEGSLPEADTGDAREIGSRLLACVKVLQNAVELRASTGRGAWAIKALALAAAALAGEPEEIPNGE